MIGRRLYVALIAVLLVIAAGGLAVWLTDRLADTGNPASAAIGGPFTLTDQDGKTVTENDLKGKWSLVFFGYTHCPDACPTALSDIAEALDQLGDKAEKVRPVFITVDPQRDTPQVLKDYLGSFDIPVMGLTGSKDQIDRAAKAYRVYYQLHTEKGDDYPVDHTTIIYVMDPDGRFVANFSHETPPDRMAQRLAKLIS